MNIYGKVLIHKQFSRPPTVYKISGQVTLSGSGQSGATVYLIDETAGAIIASTSTDGSGNYSFGSGLAITPSRTYHVTAQIDTGGQKYNSASQPYLVPAEG